MKMTVWTHLFFVGAFLLVGTSLYLTLAKDFKTGFVGAIGMGMCCLGFAPMIVDYLTGTVYDIPWPIAVGVLGCGLFRLQHASRFKRYYWVDTRATPIGKEHTFERGSLKGN